MIIELHAKSDVGRVRRGNEDNFVARFKHRQGTDTLRRRGYPPELSRFDLGDKGLVLVVSDGMGGALAGDVASKMAVEAVREMLVGSEDDAEK
jgi:protein phosphatase